MIIITIIIIVIIMIIIIMIIIQDYLQNTIDKINIRNFKKFKIMYNTKAFSLKNALKKKNFRFPQWRRLFCSLRSVLSCCEKVFVILSRMRVPILDVRKRFVS